MFFFNLFNAVTRKFELTYLVCIYFYQAALLEEYPKRKATIKCSVYKNKFQMN